MKKIFFPVLYTSLLLWGTSASASLLETSEVLCNPAKYGVVINDENGNTLFNQNILQAIVTSRGGTGACMNSIDSFYTFTPISDQNKEVTNPASGDIEPKIVVTVQTPPA